MTFVCMRISALFCSCIFQHTPCTALLPCKLCCGDRWALYKGCWVSCRGVTTSQIARATDAERAEARSLSADRRLKLRLDLGDSEGVSTLLENSLLGAEREQLPSLALGCMMSALDVCALCLQNLLR